MKEERLFYLRRMNAWPPTAPKPAARAPLDRETAPGAKPAKRRDAAAAGARRRRGRRTATGCATRSSGASPTSATWIWCATCRASSGAPGFELFYSEGFHPKPELSFGPALGLGIPSLGELLDVTLVDDVSPDELLRRLARVTLDGIEFLEAARLGPADRARRRRRSRRRSTRRVCPTSVDVGGGLRARRRQRAAAGAAARRRRRSGA